MDKKQCTSCGKEKPLDEFAAEKRNKDGKDARCKACGIARRKKYQPGVYGGTRRAGVATAFSKRQEMIAKYGIAVVEAMDEDA